MNSKLMIRIFSIFAVVLIQSTFFTAKAQESLVLESTPFKGWLVDSVAGNPKTMIITEYDYVEKFGEWIWKKEFEETHEYDNHGNFIEINRNDLRNEHIYSESFQYSTNKVTTKTNGEDRPYSQMNTPSEKTYSLNDRGLVTEYLGTRQFGYQFSNNVLYEYDNRDRISKITVYSFDDLFKIITASYNSAHNQPLEIKAFNSRGNMTGRIVYEYNTNQKLSKELYYSKSSYGEELEKTVIYYYDSRDHISSVEHHGGGRGYTLHNYEYDGSGHLSKITELLVNAGAEEIIEMSQFTCDTLGRWTEKIQYNFYNSSRKLKPFKKTTRTFKTT